MQQGPARPGLRSGRSGDRTRRLAASRNARSRGPARRNLRWARVPLTGPALWLCGVNFAKSVMRQGFCGLTPHNEILNITAGMNSCRAGFAPAEAQCLSRRTIESSRNRDRERLLQTLPENYGPAAKRGEFRRQGRRRARTTQPSARLRCPRLQSTADTTCNWVERVLLQRIRQSWLQRSQERHSITPTRSAQFSH